MFRSATDLGYERKELPGVRGKAVYEFRPLQFCFVGPRGVGKSSLLASMYHELEEKRSIDNFYIDISTSTGRRTQVRLSNAKREMLSMLTESAPYATAALGLGLRGDADEMSVYEFVGRSSVQDTSLSARLLGREQKEFRFPFRFIDMPGGWYRAERIDDETAARVKNTLEASDVSFLAIDTPALMESPALCMEYNHVDTIKAWYEASLDRLSEQQHTVVMVLSRCERYHNDKRAMYARLRSTYATLIRKLKNAGIKVYATYVQTLGGMEFETYETIQRGSLSLKVARFIKTGDYTPENCATPLLLALRHGLLRSLEQLNSKKAKNRLVAWSAALGWNNVDTALQAARGLIEVLDERVQNDQPSYELL